VARFSIQAFSTKLRIQRLLTWLRFGDYSPFSDCNVDLSFDNFRNNDLPEICELWNQHHTLDRGAVPGLESQMQPDRMELFVQSKISFDARRLVIARHQGQAVGFVHLCEIPSHSLEEAVSEQVGIAALCVKPGQSQDSVAAGLLNVADDQATLLGANRIAFRPALPRCSLYMGIGPADSLAGALSFEERICRWLTAAGYKPAVPTTLWELNLEKFRVPGDRIQILVRRRSLVDRQLQEPSMPWWQSCVLGHAEVTAFHLFDRIEKRALQEIVLWSLAPSLTDGRKKVIWLWPPKMDYSPEDAPVEIAPVDRLVFLLAEALRHLQTEHVDTIRTVTNAEANEMHQVLQRLGFSAVDSGIVFEKDLSSQRPSK
jgi:hypothetical protein